MNAVLDPLISEFPSSDAASQYDAWLQAKIARSIADGAPRLPHDQVMAEMQELLATKRAAIPPNAG